MRKGRTQKEKRDEVLEAEPLLDITYTFNKQNSSVKL